MRWRTVSPLLLVLCGVTCGSAVNFTCCTGSNCTGGVSNDPVTCAALGDLYYATSGNAWSAKQGWSSAAAGTATDFCTFAQSAGGCDGAGVLTSLYVAGVGLKGTIPTSLGRLTSLTYLNLQYNLLTGTLPSSLGSLMALTSLILPGNQLGGSIPSSFGNLTSLQYLSLAVNPLSGSLPPCLGALTGLTFLDLGDCLFNGTIPDTIFGTMTALTTLRLGSNLFSGALPVSVIGLCLRVALTSTPCNFAGLAYGSQTGCSLVFNFSTLSALPNSTQSIYVAGGAWGVSAITGGIPNLSAFTALTSLVVFGMYNSLTGTVPDMFSTMAALTNVVLGYNALSGALPPSALVLCSTSSVNCDFSFTNILLYPNCSVASYLLSTYTPLSTNIQSPPQCSPLFGGMRYAGTLPSLASYTSLTSIRLANLGLYGTLPASWAGLSNLARLDLNGNSLAGSLPASLASLTSLAYLDLSNNVLSSTIPDIWATLTGLTYLSLASNQLVGSLPQSFSSFIGSIQLTSNVGLNGTVSTAILANCAYSSTFLLASAGSQFYCSWFDTGLSFLGMNSGIASTAAFNSTPLLVAISSVNATQAVQAAQFSSSNSSLAALTAQLGMVNASLVAQAAQLNAAMTAQLNIMNASLVAQAAQFSAALTSLTAQLSSVNSTLAAQSSGAPRSVSISLGGYTIDTFGTAAQSAFASAIANTTGAPASSVNITSIAAAAGAPAAGRHLMVASGVTVGFTVPTPLPGLALAALVASPLFNTTMATSYAAAGQPLPSVAAVNGVASPPPASQSAALHTLRPKFQLLAVLLTGAALIV